MFCLGRKMLSRVRIAQINGHNIREKLIKFPESFTYSAEGKYTSNITHLMSCRSYTSSPNYATVYASYNVFAIVCQDDIIVRKDVAVWFTTRRVKGSKNRVIFVV